MSRNRSALGLLAIALLLAALLPAGAAAKPKTVWQACGAGTGAGQCVLPRGIEADPTSGHLYVADQNNARVDELTAWGEFVKAWGWGVLDGAEELQTCTAETGCRGGLIGAGEGQFGKFSPQGVAVDSTGDVYVTDFINHRIEKFDPAAGPPGEEKAELLVTFGGKGTGNGQFDWDFELGDFIDVGPGDTIYVGDHGRIQKFDSTGNYLESVSLPGEAVQALAVDPAGNIFVGLFMDEFEEGRSKADVLKLDPTGLELCRAKGEEPQAIATDATGNLYTADGRMGIVGRKLQVRKFDPGCKEVEDGQFPFADGFNRSTGIATNTVTEAGGTGLYLSNLSLSEPYVRAYYPPPDKWPAPSAAPSITDQYAASADTDSAVLRARINPNFWADTTYYVEYGTTECALGGCNARPLPPGTLLSGDITSEDITTAGVFLSGLAPGTTYHYRFVAGSSGGGPVRGLGGTEGEDGAEATFTTFPNALVPTNPCPNTVFRGGSGASLPDCRAYEMVSPLDKNNGDIEVLDSSYRAGYNKAAFARIVQASPEGEKLTYSATRAFANPESAPWSSQYLAIRDPQAGWGTESISPPRSNLLLNSEANTEVPFKAFSEDLCSGWYLQETDLQQSEAAPPDVPNLYRRRLCAPESYEVITSVPPPGFSAASEPLRSKYSPEIQGFSADGAHSFLHANGRLTADATGKDVYRLYETSKGGGMALISVLPSGIASKAHSSLGTSAEGAGDFRNDSVAGAVSTDGSRVFWTESTVEGSETPNSGSGFAERPEPGNLYLRANPLAEQSSNGKCIERGKACSLRIGGPNAEFWTADPTGSLAIYQIGDELFEARIAESGESLTSKSTLIAEGVTGVLGTSEGATELYFTSSNVLAAGAVAGKPNLYFRRQKGGPRFIGTLSDLDSSHHDFPSVDNIKPNFRKARVSADGLHAAFTSHASLTGYDNTDVESGEPDAEVFLYDAGAGEGAGELHCISCNPSGARPAGHLIGKKNEEKTQIYAAAQIRPWEYQLHAPRLLSEDALRIYFESYEALVPSDTNGARDVYEWSRSGDEKACEEIGAPIYVPSAAGCLSLISSGKSPEDSEFVDASADGRDVFFTTAESLFAEDTGLIDIYDARVGGGFAPKPSVAPCQGESCQGSSAAPSDQTPASTTFRGAGDPNPRVRARRCPQGRRKVRKAGKARCTKVARKHKRNQEQRRANR